MDKKLLSKKDQLKSMVQAYENPDSLSLSDGINNIKSALGVNEQPMAPKPLPGEGEGFNDEAAIAEMQAANMAQAQQDPAIAARLAATREAIKRHQAMQAAKLQKLPGIQQQISGKIGQSYPAEE